MIQPRPDSLPGHDANWSLRASIPPLPDGAGRQRALVLGGGGAAGNAWEIGVIAGLLLEGIDLTAADLIVGTSAGATAAAQLTLSDSPASLYGSILDERWPTPTPAPDGSVGPSASATPYLDWSQAVIDSASDAADFRRRLGAATRAHGVDAEASRRWRTIVERRLPEATWPERRVVIAAVDADTGEPVAFTVDSGVDLVDAVAASTTLGFGGTGPYRLGERGYLDGGYRRGENADLAAGSDLVVILAPFGGRSRMPARWRMDLESQCDELRASGSAVVTIVPQPELRDIFEGGAGNPALRRRAAEGGHADHERIADLLRGFWDAPPRDRGVTPARP